MPPNSTTYAVRVPWKDACTIIPEAELEALAKTGVDRWRKKGVPSHVMLLPVLEFWNTGHKSKVGIIIEEWEKQKKVSRVG